MPASKRAKPDHIGRLRLELATAYRLAAKHGLNEGVCNHFTASTNDLHDQFLVIPHGISWALVQPEQLLLVDAEGKVIEGHGEVEITALTIHAAVHQACKGSGTAVFHTHMPWATTMCCLKRDHGGQLLQIHQNCCRFLGAIKYDDRYGGLSEDMTEGCAIAQAFRGATEPTQSQTQTRVVFLANHGVIVVGESIARAWDDLYYLERACQVQVQALMAAGGDMSRIVLIDSKVAEHTAQQERKLLQDGDYAEKLLASGLAELRHSDPTFGI